MVEQSLLGMHRSLQIEALFLAKVEPVAENLPPSGVDF
jgi:hypothetical protein